MMKIHNTQQMQEGAGATVRRLMPVAGLRNFDPFVLWDDFTITPGTGFPDHPHRGFEAITYLFQGSIRHRDNLDNDSTVSDGGAQRFTAGRGIVHSEMPATDRPTRGIQLWVNLPKRLKDVEPAYQQVNADSFPTRDISGGRITTIVGDTSPLKLLTPAQYENISLTAGGRYRYTNPEIHRGFVYVVSGAAHIDDMSLNGGQAALFSGVRELSIAAGDQGCHLMLCAGGPHGEPIIQHGPFVD